MSATDALPIIAGFLTVWIAAVLNRPNANPTTKRVVVVAVAVVLAVLSLIVSGQIVELPSGAVQWTDKIVGYVGLAIVASQGFYRVLEPGAKAVEGAVGPSAHPDPAD